MLDIRQTSAYAKYLSETGWKVERVGNVNYFIKKLPFVGSIIKVQRPKDIRYQDIKILAKRHRAFQIIIEPKNTNYQTLITKHGFKLSRSPFLPSKTLHLDLTKTKNQLLKGMKKDARSAIRGARDIELKRIENSKEIQQFRELWRRAGGWKRYVPRLDHLVALKESFGENALFLASENSGAIFLTAGKTAHYWQAFTNKEGRKAQIQYKIVWEGILWAKKKGAKVFDFEGIYDERFPDKSWLGFTHFKKSFGGYEVTYPGAYTKTRLPV